METSLLKNYKLIVTIVKKGAARKAVGASKTCGAEGGTTLMGQGSGVHDKERFFGISFLPEKEIILTLVCDDDAEEVLHSMCDSCSLQKPRHGLAMVLDVAGVTGICHLCQLAEEESEEGRLSEMETEEKDVIQHDLIVTIVNKGDSETVIEATKQAGARGGTILFGRGTGIHEQAKLFGITIEPEKEIILTLIERSKTLQVLDRIVQAVDLDQAGKGIAFIMKVDQVTGISEIDQLKEAQKHK